MRLTRILLVGAAATILSASAAMAADPIYMPPGAPAAPFVPAPVAYNWGGFYVGGFAGRTILAPGATAVGGQVGFNFQPGNFVIGIEGRGGTLLGTPIRFFEARGKGGFTLGASGNVLLYGTASIGRVPAGPATYYTAGGGVEIGIGRLSVFAETVGVGIAPGPIVGTAFQAGLNFHFN